MADIQFIDPEQLSHDIPEPENPELNANWLERFLDIRSDALALKYWCDANGIKDSASVRPSIIGAIERIDALLNDQVNEILHSIELQALEASWRGLHYLVTQKAGNESEQESKIKLLSCSWGELARDSQNAIEFDQTNLFKLIYQNEFSMPGGEPFGLIVGDYHIQHKPGSHQLERDLEVLTKISQTAAAAFCPFLVSATPSLFGVDRFAQLATTAAIETQFELPEYGKWHQLRNSEDARFLAITLPFVLMRKPYKKDGSRLEAFAFKEKIANSEEDLLWGNASYCLASVVLRAYSESGWFAQIRGMRAGNYQQGVVFPPVNVQVTFPGRKTRHRTPVNFQVSERKEQRLSDSGFIPMSPVAETPFVSFSTNASLHQPQNYEQQGAAMNAQLSSMLQYTLCVSRIAHYIKVMGRDKVGRYQNAATIESDFQRWLHQYTTGSDEASDELRAKYPLNEARIQVKEKQGSPGHYYSIIHLRPHFQLDQMVTSIRLITELSPEKII